MHDKDDHTAHPDEDPMRYLDNALRRSTDPGVREALRQVVALYRPPSNGAEPEGSPLPCDHPRRGRASERVLIHLAGTTGPWTVQDVSRHAQCDEATARTVLNRLAANGEMLRFCPPPTGHHGRAPVMYSLSTPLEICALLPG
jgi:hypothetical protein